MALGMAVIELQVVIGHVEHCTSDWPRWTDLNSMANSALTGRNPFFIKDIRPASTLVVSGYPTAVQQLTRST
jgi:hypothetical protein